MRWKKPKYLKGQLLIVSLVVGFFLGILYENIVANIQGTSVDLFTDYFLKQYRQVDLISEEYFLFVLRIRTISFLLICILGLLKWKKILANGVCLWYGFLAGIYVVSAVIQLGVKGILFCVISMFPHMLLYALAYGMVLTYFNAYPKQQWNHAKTIFVVLMMFVGMMLETYVSSGVIKWMMGFL